MPEEFRHHPDFRALSPARWIVTHEGRGRLHVKPSTLPNAIVTAGNFWGLTPEAMAAAIAGNKVTAEDANDGGTYSGRRLLKMAGLAGGADSAAADAPSVDEMAASVRGVPGEGLPEQSEPEGGDVAPAETEATSGTQSGDATPD